MYLVFTSSSGEHNVGEFAVCMRVLLLLCSLRCYESQSSSYSVELCRSDRSFVPETVYLLLAKLSSGAASGTLSPSKTEEMSPVLV